MIRARPSRAAHTIAWLGGAAFIASLAYFIRFYTWELEVLAPSSDPRRWARSLAANTALFTVFALHHSLFARTRAKAWIARVIPPSLERSFYVWTSSLLFFAICRFWVHVPSNLFLALEGPAFWVSRATQVAGITLIGLGMRSIDPFELAGIRQVWTQAGAAHPAHGEHAPRLSSAFPHTLVRHPIYLGWILMTFGTSPVTADRLLFASLGAAYLVMAIPWEERSLIGAFGGEYERYQAEVRWRLIPGVW